MDDSDFERHLKDEKKTTFVPQNMLHSELPRDGLK